MKKRERTDIVGEVEDEIKAEPPEDKENQKADDTVGELRDATIALSRDYFFGGKFKNTG